MKALVPLYVALIACLPGLAASLSGAHLPPQAAALMSFLFTPVAAWPSHWTPLGPAIRYSYCWRARDCSNSAIPQDVLVVQLRRTSVTE